MNRSQKIDKLLRVKELRKQLAEHAAARASGSHARALHAFRQAEEAERNILQVSEERRQKRIAALLEVDENPSTQNVRIMNAYYRSVQEVEETRASKNNRLDEAQEAKNRLKLAQSKLAQNLREVDRTKKLCERLAKLQQVEKLRSG